MEVPKTNLRNLDLPPDRISSYNPGARSEPPIFQRQCESDTFEKYDLMAKKKNLLWLITRVKCEMDQTVPSWTGFNILIRKDKLVIKDNIGYLPSINAPASSMWTMYEMICQAIQIKEQLGITAIVLVCDQAIYAKAAEVAWKHINQFKSIILRLGA